jgi:membrane-anchored mycosin MYCP
VAVLDTGVSAAAPPLAGAVRPGQDVVVTGSADSDCAGRGTALAGIVAARPVTGSPFAGLAPEATILPVRVTDRHNQFNARTLADGIAVAATAGAHVILVGTGVPVDTAELRAAVQAAVQRGAVVVAPVNPDGPSGGRPPATWYPAAYDEVIGVGAVGADGASLTADSVAGCDLLAPGSNSISIAPVGDGHYAVGGTPVAAAHVAGVAALVRAYYPALPPAAVRERLLATAEALPGRPPVLDAYAAVTATAPTRAVPATGEGGAVIAVPTPSASPKPGRAAAFLAGALTVLFIAVLAAGAARAGRRRER